MSLCISIKCSFAASYFLTVMLNAFMPSAVILNVIMLDVVAPVFNTRHGHACQCHAITPTTKTARLKIENLDQTILGEMINLQKVNLPKNQLAKKSTCQKSQLAKNTNFGYFMLRLTFWQVDFLVR